MSEKILSNYFEKENNICLANAINKVDLEISSTFYSTIISRKRSLKGFVLWKHRVVIGGKNKYGKCK